ncbi:DUF4292 domain-containing protein [Pelodictyon luteolum]|uniref:DUF4292 domain-containing protein n=1 Tax=Chlorobium luteolum (strain DSM 273 / BCRC 81028 / 2530) TaxID=319225 RepID=Q3B3J4_CHLL3|nr:DUF4292 domain-containing protein [Pelodictyon luteolum]ABB24087.1 conserved hypothetical protein [Pelodictyon luteolum DSM 273]
MMRKNGVLAWALLLALSVMVSGCSGFRTVSRQELPLGEAVLSKGDAALYQRVRASAPFITSVDGYADVWLKTLKHRHKVYCSIRVNRGGESRMLVSAGFIGLPVADIFIGRDSVLVHDMLRNRYFSGGNNERNLEKILGVSSGPMLISGSLLGLMDIPEPAGAIRSVQKGDGLVSFSIASGSGAKVVVADSASGTLRALQVKDGAGRLTSEMHFKDFEACMVDGKSAMVPRTIEMVLQGDEGKGERQLVISYDERAFNRRNGSMRPVVPDNARVVSLEESDGVPWL